MRKWMLGGLLALAAVLAMANDSYAFGRRGGHCGSGGCGVAYSNNCGSGGCGVVSGGYIPQYNAPVFMPSSSYTLQANPTTYWAQPVEVIPASPPRTRIEVPSTSGYAPTPQAKTVWIMGDDGLLRRASPEIEKQILSQMK